MNSAPFELRLAAELISFSKGEYVGVEGEYSSLLCIHDEKKKGFGKVAKRLMPLMMVRSGEIKALAKYEQIRLFLSLPPTTKPLFDVQATCFSTLTPHGDLRVSQWLLLEEHVYHDCVVLTHDCQMTAVSSSVHRREFQLVSSTDSDLITLEYAWRPPWGA